MPVSYMEINLNALRHKRWRLAQRRSGGAKAAAMNNFNQHL